jgi:TonB family protein
LSRNLDGLFNFEQMSILSPLIDSLIALDRHDDVERSLDYAVRVSESAYGKSDVHVIRPLIRSARWQEKTGRYTTARVLYARALQIAEDVGGSGTIYAVDPLEGIARTYRLEYADGGDVRPVAPDVEDALAGGEEQKLNPDGERAIFLALKAINKAQPVDHTRRGTALMELGDWYFTAGDQVTGLKTYGEAWRDLSSAGSTTALASPRQLAYRAPLAAVSRAKADDRDNMEEHFVEVSFTVTREGRVTDLTISDTNGTESQQKSVVAAVRKARYAPRLENGVAVDSSNVKFRERLLSKKPRAPAS